MWVDTFFCFRRLSSWFGCPSFSFLCLKKLSLLLPWNKDTDSFCFWVYFHLELSLNLNNEQLLKHARNICSSGTRTQIQRATDKQLLYRNTRRNWYLVALVQENLYSHRLLLEIQRYQRRFYFEVLRLFIVTDILIWNTDVRTNADLYTVSKD